LDDPFDAADAEDDAGLDQLLGDNGGRSVGIEKAMTDDVAHDLGGAAVVLFGSALLGCQAGGAVLDEELAELKVALPTEAKLVGGGLRSEFTFALHEHGQAASDLIVSCNGQGAGAAHKGLRFRGVWQHACLP